MKRTSPQPLHLVLLGGHLTPALAVAEYVKNTQPEVQLTLIGRQYSQDRLKQLSQEAQESKKLGMEFIPFEAPRISFAHFWEPLLFPFTFLSSVLSAIPLLKKLKPSAVVSFGSYLAVPVSFASWLLGIPVVTHEQTRSAGQATSFIGFFAKKIAFSFPEVAKKFPAQKAVVTGTPIRSTLLIPPPHAPSWFKQLGEAPLLLILGGNQGSATINHVMAQALPELVKSWTVIHQCGNPTLSHNYKRDLERAQLALPKNQQNRYHVAEWFSNDEIGWLLRKASLVVTRSGANTVYELAVLHIPSVLIPLPIARHQEQHQNALWLSQKGGALLLPQRDLSPKQLVETVNEGYRKRARLRRSLTLLHTPTDGAKQFFDVITSVLR